MINIPKGTKDCLPSESYKWRYVENAVRKVMENYGVKEIRTPIFEHTEVFLRGVGDTTDIVNKEMYTFADKGGRSVTLKPEGTSGVVRSFVENGMANGTLPAKLYYITPCFRYERPQNGRLRQFHQCGTEYFGSISPLADVEVIMLAKEILSGVGVTNLSLEINSIGCKECRAEYLKVLKAYFESKLDKLCPLCADRYDKNPLRILDCKNAECKEICEKAPKINDYLCDDCNKHFETVKTCLNNLGVEFTVNPFIVRGLDYYTKTVFEFVSNEIGAQGTVCGGGRYDNLVEELGGNHVPAVGFGMGIERLMLVLENSGKLNIPNEEIKVYVGSIGEKASITAFETVSLLRAKGIATECDLMQKSVKAQMKYADKIKAQYSVIIGDNEIETNKVNVKKMADGTSEEVLLSDLVKYFSKN